MRQLTVAYIGNGRSTNRYHIPFVLTRPKQWRIKSVYERRRGGSKWKYLEGVVYTDNLDDILQDPEIDLVSISTLHDSHYDYAMRCLRAGKNIIVEKPFCVTSEQAEEIFDYAHERGLFATAMQNRRYDSDFLTLQKVVHSGKLGDVYEIANHFDYYRPYTPEACHEYNPYLSFVYGHAVHSLDQAVSLFGKPDSAHFDTRQMLGPGRMNDYFDIDLNYGALKYSVRASYFRAHERPSFEAYGTRGYFVKQKKDRQEEHLKLFYMPGQERFGIDRPEDYGTLIWYDDEGVYHEEKVVSEVGDYARIYDGIYDALVNNAEQPIKPEHTMLVMHILEDALAGLS